jgi:glycosyltransferase involved in cell wall biosynthesis
MLGLVSKVAIIVPVLRRPQNVAPLLDSIRAATPEPYRVLFVPNPGDTAEIAEILANDGEIIAFVDGGYAQKINAAVDLCDEPLIFTGADDLDFQSGWLESAARLTDKKIGVVGTNDMCNRRVMSGDHSTHSLVTRWYCEIGTFDQPGKLLHEGYDHSFCDDELVQTAMRRGAFAAAKDSVVIHNHPMRGRAADDEIYEKGREKFMQDKRLFRRRLVEMREAIR